MTVDFEAELHGEGDGCARSVVHKDKMLQEVSSEERYGLLPSRWGPTNPDKRGTDNACEVDRGKANARKDEPAREERVRVDSPYASDLGDADLLHGELLKDAGINRADARAGVDERYARYRRWDGSTSLLELCGDRGRHFDLNRENRARRLKARRKRLMRMRRRFGGMRGVRGVIDGHRGVRAPARVRSGWARRGGSA